MKLYEKLLHIQTEIDSFTKDTTIGEGKQKYKAVGSEQVLNIVRPLMNELKLLLIPSVTAGRVTAGKTSGGTDRYLTEIDMIMTWHDVESGEELAVPWYAQGVDLAGEKGVGKANTYGEKYFFMKFFHVPTPADDPDNAARTKSGELKQVGTQAAAETALYYRRALEQMLFRLCDGDPAKIKQACIAYTANPGRGYNGAESVSQISEKALPVLYGKVKKKYEDTIGEEFVLAPEKEDNE